MLSNDILARIATLHAHERVASGPIHPPMRIGPGDAAQTPARMADDNVLSAGSVVENASGTHLLLCRRVSEFWPAADRTAAAVAGGAGSRPHRHVELAALAESFPRGMLLLDLETCGFAGSMVFLAGLVRYEGGLVLEQLLARNYAEERALLETLWQVAARHRVLVTFNGKSFDWPMVHDRSTRHHLGRDLRGCPADRRQTPPIAGGLGRNDARPELVHCDVLHHARRRWKHLLPDCRLQTLERTICQRRRHDDMPGWLVPAVYHEFVRTGHSHGLGAILRHNALDLVTLAQLACRLIADPATASVPAARRA